MSARASSPIPRFLREIYEIHCYPVILVIYYLQAIRLALRLARLRKHFVGNWICNALVNVMEKHTKFYNALCNI